MDDLTLFAPQTRFHASRDALLRRRRQNRETGDVWRFVRLGDKLCTVMIVRERDGKTVTISESTWLDDQRWVAPKSRSGRDRG